MSNYIGKELDVTQKIISNNTEWIEISVDGTYIGWAKADSIEMNDFIELNDLNQEFNDKIWNNYKDENKEVVDKLSNYVERKMKINQLITLENQTQWIEITIKDKIIGWIEIETSSIK